MPGDNNLKLLATCAVVSNRVSASSDDTVGNTESDMSMFMVNKANMKYISKLYLDKDLSDVDLEFMIVKFGQDRRVHVKEFLKAVSLRKICPTIANDESRYYNSVRYKHYHGRGVCAICGKTVALTRRGVLRLHKCV